MFTTAEVERAIYHRFIVPAQKPREEHVGVEFELPLLNTGKRPVDFNVVHEMVSSFMNAFSFRPVRYDDEGNLLAVADAVTGDDLTFDCSYNTVEFSFGRETDLTAVQKRFRKYYFYLQSFLQRHGHTITGMGLNPYRQYNRAEPIPNGRYRMLLHHLRSYEKYKEQKQFHDQPDYGLFACAAQTHVDAHVGDLPETLSLYNRLEPLKALLFANSPFKGPDGEYLCVRDHLWRDSMHGLNPHNVDGWEAEPHSIGEVVAYIRSMSLYCTERDGHYINFVPTRLDEYFSEEMIQGEFFDGSGYREIRFRPDLADLEYLRSFKLVDLTFRGTIELRSACMQPVREAMTVPALSLGLVRKHDRLRRLLDEAPIYHQGYTPVELRKLFVRRKLPAFAREEELRDLLTAVVDLAGEGLAERGFGEENLLIPLRERARRAESPALEMVRGIEKGRSIEYYIREFGAL